jgi:hypothetical protein
MMMMMMMIIVIMKSEVDIFQAPFFILFCFPLVFMFYCRHKYSVAKITQCRLSYAA